MSTSGTPHSGAITRRYRTDTDYTKDAASMAAAGWRVADLRRLPDSTISATYTYFQTTSPTPTPSAAGPNAAMAPAAPAAPTTLDTPVTPTPTATFTGDTGAPGGPASLSAWPRATQGAPSSIYARANTVGQVREWFGRQAPRAKAAWGIGVAALSLLLVCACCSAALANGNTGATTADNTGGSPGPTNVAQEATQSAQNAAQATATSAAYLASFSATATVLAKVTPAPTETPAPTATDTPVPYQLTIDVTCDYATDYSWGQVCVHTHPGAILSIVVTYCSGYTAKSASLQGTRTANSHGNFTWGWTPETNCPGPADAFVTADWGGQEATADPTFNVN